MQKILPFFLILVSSFAAQAAQVTNPVDLIDSSRGNSFEQNALILDVLKKFTFAEIEAATSKVFAEDEITAHEGNLIGLVRDSFIVIPKLRFAAKAYVQAAIKDDFEPAVTLAELSLYGTNEWIRKDAARELRHRLEAGDELRSLQKHFLKMPPANQRDLVVSLLQALHLSSGVQYLTRLAPARTLRPIVQSVKSQLYFRDANEGAARYLAETLAAEKNWPAIWTDFLTPNSDDYGDPREAALNAMQSILEKTKSSEKASLLSFIKMRPYHERLNFFEKILETAADTPHYNRRFLFELGDRQEVIKMFGDAKPLYSRAKAEKANLFYLFLSPDPHLSPPTEKGLCAHLLAKLFNTRR